MRVCHPGPVALQRSSTSAGSRREINFRGFAESGLPPLLTFARASMSLVRRGSSSYSLAFILCASTRSRSDFKERRDAGFFAAIGFPHAENVAIRATRRIADDDHSALQPAIANHASFAIVFSQVLDLHGHTRKDVLGVGEIQSPIGLCSSALGLIEEDLHSVIVYT